MEANKLTGFDYFPFLKQLLRKGKYSWATPETKGKEKFVTTLYIDGDMMCWFLDSNSREASGTYQEELTIHLQKINRNLNSIKVLSNQLGLLTLLITLLLTFSINPQGWIENLIIVTTIGILGTIFRKFIRPLIFKVAGKLIGKFLS